MSSNHAGDYHGHPNYFLVWVGLMGLFFASLVANEIGNRSLAITLIFALAVVKAVMVLGNFMHLRWEPKILWGILGFAFLCLVFLYYGVMTDILWVPLQIAH